MEHNYSKLLGRIREKGLTQKQLAEKIGITHGTLSVKLNEKYPFTTRDINAICKVLDISKGEIGDYFFAE